MCEGNNCANCEYLYNGEYCLYRQEYIEDKDIYRKLVTKINEISKIYEIT